MNSNLLFGRAALALALLAFSAGRVQADVQFQSVGPGIELATFTVNPGARPTIELTVVRVDVRLARLVVVDLRHIGAGSSAPVSSQLGYSLRELDRLRHPKAMINGGFTNSLVLPQPSGLVRVAGRVTNKLNAASTKQTAVLCIAHDGTVTILGSREASATHCYHALQAGPIVVEAPGINGIHASATNQRFVRSLLGIDADGRALLIHSSTASLFDVAEALTGKLSEGLTLRLVMNLDGDTDSGLLVHRGNEGDVVLGNVDATIPTAIAVISR
jgi:uncharacterized protein YigE (DUF2233 family)